MKVHIFHATAGHGHKKAADVLGKAFLERGLSPKNILVEDSLTSCPWFFRKAYPAVYYYSVKNTPKAWGWSYELLDQASVYRAIKGFRSLNNQIVGASLLKREIREKPDTIISTHFLTAELFATAKRKGKIQSKLVTVITDFYPHSFWVNDGTDFYWVMSEEGKAALEKRGVEPDRIIVGGIPVDANFKPSGQKSTIRKQYGFDNTRFTLFFTSGSFGLGPQMEMLEEMKPFADKIQCFVVCGNNAALKKTLDQKQYPFPVKNFGFVNNMHELMEASDLMIAKPGGATTAEALSKGVPMVVIDPIPGQESRNAALLKERNAAFFIAKSDQLPIIVKTVLVQPELLEIKQRAIQGLAKPHAADDLVTFVLKGIKIYG